ncbi:MAG: TIGR03620 family F420-dependent LLM class oxidoreductase [Actinobacteria bacterium]|nr:TIGR03620 family F420-dependent LLM class oxidoreductase [Actinomycetota bacterium]
MRWGRVGVWQGGYGPAATVDRDMIAELEELGYGSFWFGEAPGGKEAFTRAATLLAASSSIVVGTGIASVWGRDPLNISSAIRTVGEAFPGRFVAGLGVSHPPAVEARGERYVRPFSLMRDVLAGMAAAQHQSPAPSEPAPVVLAALRPRMLELAATAADGAHPYFVPVEHTARAREIMGPDALLVPELAVVLERDPVRARELARLHTGGFYLQAPNYVENLRWLGWSDDDLAGAGSDALVDAVVAWGDEDAIVTRIREHLDAGADHVCLQPVTEVRPLVDGPDTQAMELLRRLADAVRSV